MELLIEVFAGKTGWSRKEFLEIYSQTDNDLYCLQLGYMDPLLNHEGKQCQELNAENYAIEATETMREIYPKFTVDISRKSRLIDLYVWKNQLSWWYLMPFSERSSLRSPLVQILYWFCIIDIALKNNKVSKVYLACDNGEYSQVLQTLCDKHGITNESVYCVSNESNSRMRWLIRFAYGLLRRTTAVILKWLLLKYHRFDKLIDRGSQSEARYNILCTVYPTYYEHDNEGRLQETLFGSWGDYLQSKGHPVLHAAHMPLQFYDIKRQHREEAAANNIVIYDALLTFGDLLKVLFDYTFMLRYWRWKNSNSGQEMFFLGVDIQKLIFIELDETIYLKHAGSQDLQQCYGIKRLIEKLGGANSIQYTFEFQVRERAIELGLRLAGYDVASIGIQSNVMIKKYLNWCFLSEESEQSSLDSYDPSLAPLPDYLAVCGQQDFHHFKNRFQEDRIAVTGSLRHSKLAIDAHSSIDNMEFRNEHNIPSNATIILITTSVSRQESLHLIELMFSSAAGLGDLFLAVKFHPMCPLENELVVIAQKYNFSSYKIFSSNLNYLIKASEATVLHATSVGVLAIALNSMPIVFHQPGNFIPYQLCDYPDSGFFFQDQDELKLALNSCLSQDMEYQNRRKEWPVVMETLFYRLDNSENHRLYDFLETRGLYS